MVFGSNVNQLPVWNYDGSSTGQATGKNSEVLLGQFICVMTHLEKYKLFYVKL